MGRDDRAPEVEELNLMKTLFRKSLDQGSWGLSSELQYVPENIVDLRNYGSQVRVLRKYINDPATFLEPHQYAKGIDYVWINGSLVVDQNKFNSTYAGKVLLASDSAN